MPAFFIPYCSKNQQERIYNRIKTFLQSKGFKLNSNRIFSISYIHNGVTYTDTVGEGNMLITELVIAIYETDSMYLSCTATRGGLKGDPLLIDKNFDTIVIYFDTP